MRIPEAKLEIVRLLYDEGLPVSQLGEKVEGILDKVWLEAYEEGREGVFETIGDGDYFINEE